MKTLNSSLKFPFFTLAIVLLISSCKKDKDEEIVPEPLINTIPEFYKADIAQNYGKTAPALTLIATSNDQLSEPHDLDFNPDPSRPNELWVINRSSENTGGSTVMFTNPGTTNQTKDYRKDGNAWHFMSLPTAIAFSNKGTWATSSAVTDANHSGGSFAGPTLWSSDLNIYAVIGKPSTSAYNGSHLDMLHGSPASMGIAHDTNNVFWVYDCYNGHICRYDFAEDHGPGQHDHSDGKIHRYTEVAVDHKPGAASHIVLDKKTGWLYICDTGNKRILRMNTKTGTKKSDLSLINEPLAEHWEMENVSWEIFSTSGFQDPSGIEIKGNRLFVSDNATGSIIAYNVDTKTEIGRIETGKQGIMGLKIGPDGKLWYVNSPLDELIRIDPK